MAASATEFLEAGARLLARSGAQVSLRSLTVRAVTRETGLSTGAFYHYWDTQSEYADALRLYVMEPARIEAEDPSFVHLASLAATGTLEDLIDLFERHCAFLVTSPRFRLELLLWSLPDDDEVQATLGPSYRMQVEYNALFIEALLARTGLRLVDGVTSRDLACAVMSSLAGLALLKRVEPEVVGPMASRLVCTFLASAVMIPVDEDTRSQSLEELLSWLGGHFERRCRAGSDAATEPDAVAAMAGSAVGVHGHG
ncbi:MAG: TetR/AcrR family transcriptional regulator [Acidimicrobiales bacterium]